MAGSGQATRFRFADLLLDVGQRRVTRNGQALHLGKLTYEMLVALVEAAPNVVTHDRLIETVWGGRFATPETVAQRVKLLRLALDDDSAHPRYLEVVRGQGYRLIQRVERESAAGSPEPAESTAELRLPPARRWRAIAAVVLAAGLGAFVWYARDSRNEAAPPASAPSVEPAVRSIAVLPFADMSERKDQQYLADGIAEEILDRLAKNAGSLRVIARTSSFSFRDQQTDIPQIAARLNVSHVLEGSVRRSDDRIRLTVQLVEATDASHVWSQTYERQLGDLFTVQDDIAASVAGALHVALTEGSPAGAVAVSAESLDEFLQAKHLFGRRSPGDVERAIEHLESAVTREPGFANAWALLSGAYSVMWWHEGGDPGVWRTRQGEAARRAVELDPQLLDARDRLGRYYMDVSRIAEAKVQFAEAAKLDPDNPWLASIARDEVPWHTIDLEQQLAYEQKSLRDDPLSAIRRLNVGLLEFAAGNLAEAMSQFERSRELDPALSWNQEIEIARVLVAQKRYDEAYAEIMQLPAEGRDYGLALLYGAPGRRAEADAAYAHLRTRTDDRMHGIRLAEVLALRGELNESFRVLHATRDAIERDDAILTRMWFFQYEVRHAPFLKPLHGDPRWKQLMAMPEGDSAHEIIERLWPASRTAAVRE